MPYDEGERVWKFQVLNEERKLTGLFEPDSADTWWSSRPGSRHCRILYQANDELGKLYLLLYRFDKTKFTNEDYCQILSPEKAVAWLKEESHPVPDYLIEEANNFPLPDAQEEIWGLLEGQALTAKELAKKVSGEPFVTDSSIRKRIQAIRKQGRRINNKKGCGYYRPDAPPPENPKNV